MTDAPAALRRRRLILLTVAAVLWLVFVLAGAFTDLLGRGGGALLAAFLWHGLVGFTLARALAAPGADAFAATRNVLVATIGSLVTGFGVVILVGGA